MLETGSKAIDFTLPDEQGNPVSLHSFKGKKVALDCANGSAFLKIEKGCAVFLS